MRGMGSFVVSRRLAVGMVGHLMAVLNKVRRSLFAKVFALVFSIASERLWYYVDMIKWKDREFFNKLQIVLLIPCQGNSLRIEKRTLMEVDLESSIGNGNKASIKLYCAAAKKCTREHPFLTEHLDQRERYQVLHSVLNVISSLTGPGHIAQDICAESTCGAWYVFGLVGQSLLEPKRLEARNSKIRALLVKESTLKCIIGLVPSMIVTLDGVFKGTGARHYSRWVCLRRMAAVYGEQLEFHQKHAWDEDRMMNLLRVYLTAPQPGQIQKETPYRTKRRYPMQSPSMFSPNHEKV
mmetsp:Transcript_11713/g.21354  ORF Transcript_11713/g.21354 Transcript_11713/m.21354 type:complete len:295 (-) Transcript_11713:3919-4803(-)